MAQAVLPSISQSEGWLDRPIFSVWQRVAALWVHWELLAYGVLVLAGLLLRVWDVGGRAMHHDESLHAYYAWKLFVGQGYSYDPLMHGPFQFELVPLLYLLFGDSEFSARLLAALLGTTLIFLPYFLRSVITRPGALLAALMLAVSPAFVYFSRFIRDDIYLACFSLVLFICIARYLYDPRPWYLYAAAAASAFAIGSMEAAYITLFIFGSFLLFEALREWKLSDDGPVLYAIRRTSMDTWLTATAVFVILTVLMFSTFFTNSDGVWDSHHSICLKDCFSLHPQWNTNRKDILGGIAYWFAQHSYQRGEQPWFYYLLVLPLYEQLAVVFGLAGLAYAVARRSLLRTFLVWWAVLSLFLYSWAGEKMPWLSIHIALPFILLAGLFVGAILSSGRRTILSVVGVVFALLLAFEIHNTFLLNFVDAANPTEMLIYVQTSQDVPNVVGEINSLSASWKKTHHLASDTAMPIGLDINDVGGWPFTWYLRKYSSLTEARTFTGTVCPGDYCPVILMLDPQFNQYGSRLSSRYVIQKYRWNWWFPEDYKQWFPDNWGATSGAGPPRVIGTPQDRQHVWDWLLYRKPFGFRGSRFLYVLVRRDLVPNAKAYSTHVNSGPAPLQGVQALPAKLRGVVGTRGSGTGRLEGPRGLATDAHGSIYVADPLNHQISVYDPQGQSRTSWGGVGSQPGSFSSNNSPQAVAVGHDGLVYVADTWNQRVQVFNRRGAFIRQWGGGAIGAGPGQFYGPRGIAVSGDKVYVADTGNKRIQVFDLRGHFLSTWGQAGTAPGQFQEPSSVAIGPKGLVYVADFWNQRVQVFTPTGSYVRSWPVADWVPQSYDEAYLAVDGKSGRVYATDPQQRQVLVYEQSGRLVGQFGSAQFSLPIGIAVQPSGRVVVSDAVGSHLSLYDVGTIPTRTFQNVTAQTPKRP